jgi:DNA-binding transcriptional regulator GbsR (MarR family)
MHQAEWLTRPRWKLTARSFLEDYWTQELGALKQEVQAALAVARQNAFDVKRKAWETEEVVNRDRRLKSYHFKMEKLMRLPTVFETDAEVEELQARLQEMLEGVEKLIKMNLRIKEYLKVPVGWTL